MFIHPYFAQQRRRDLIAAAETARLARAARTRHPAWPRLSARSPAGRESGALAAVLPVRSRP